MKNKLKLKAMQRMAGITALVVVIIFSTAGCPNESAPSNQTPIAGDFNFGNLSQTAGNVTAVTVTAKSGKSPGAVSNIQYAGITTVYTKSTTIPQTVGTYTVTFDVAAASGWNAASGLAAGTLSITAAPSFTVTFNADNGTANTTQTVAQGGKATKPADPTKAFALAAGLYAGPLPTSFTFIEWRKSDGTAWNFTTDSVTSNITLTAAYTSSPINIDGQTGANIIAKAVAYINAASGTTEYTLVLGANVDNVAAITLNKNNVTLTITSVDTTERVISKGTASGAIFTIGAVAGTSTNVKLVIDGNVTLQGKSDNSAALVRINTGGSLELKGNAKITGNANTSSGGNGSGINASGTITMSGNAEISGNTTMTGSGAGVYLSGTSASPASLTMDGNAKITNNSSSQPDSNTFSDVSSGGVFIGSNATFTMNGGEISGNSAATSTGNSSGQARGGGVFINGSSSAQFIVASDAVKANIKDNTVTAAGGTAGAQVYKNAQGVFTVGGTAQANGINQGWDSWD